jgi:DNA-directed RNA polymerase specialized sigma subunit
VSVRALNPSTISPATAAMFDLLADGAWHTSETVSHAGISTCVDRERAEAITNGRRVRKGTLARGTVIDENTLAHAGAKDICRNRLIMAVRSGRIERDGDRYRMVPATIAEWTSARPTASAQPTQTMPAAPAASPQPIDTGAAATEDSDATPASKTTRGPLLFGGILEDDGFAACPIGAVDRVHFRTDREIPLVDFRSYLPTGANVTLDEGEGLYRVDGTLGTGDSLGDHIKGWCESFDIKTIGLRAEYSVKRRAPKDLPDQFLADLCKHYSRFSLKRLQRHMSTIRLHIPDSDDITQQVFEWILKAVSQYDESKGVPFGAFLATQLSKWVHDLNRNAYGRTAADAENRQQKAVASFIAEHQRRPSEKELATYLGQSVTTLRKNSQTIATLDSLRNIKSLDVSADEGTEIALPAEEQATDLLDADTETSLLSHALTTACAADPDAKGSRTAKDPNVIGWYAWVTTTWGGKSKTEVADTLDTSMRNMSVYSERAKGHMATALADLSRG